MKQTKNQKPEALVAPVEASVALAPSQPIALADDTPDLFSGANFPEAIQREANFRGHLQGYIHHHLKEGTDYGTIPGIRNSKPCLLKPGAEKFCSLLNLRPEFAVDKETIELLPSGMRDAGVLAYVCRLVERTSGRTISEGRGACTLAERQGSANTAIKIAMKRALVSAVLGVGLSQDFTQDLEDMPTAERSVAPREVAVRLAPPVTRAPEPVKSEPQVNREDWIVSLRSLADKAIALGWAPEPRQIKMLEELHLKSSPLLRTVEQKLTVILDGLEGKK